MSQISIDIIVPYLQNDFQFTQTIKNIESYVNKLNNIRLQNIIVVHDKDLDENIDILENFDYVKLISIVQGKDIKHALKQGVLASTSKLIYIYYDIDLPNVIDDLTETINYSQNYDVIVHLNNITTKLITQNLFIKIFFTFTRKIIHIFLKIRFDDFKYKIKLLNSDIKDIFLNCKNEVLEFDLEFLYLCNRKKIRVKEIIFLSKDKNENKLTFSEYFKFVKEIINVLYVHEPRFKVLKRFVVYAIIGFSGLSMDMLLFYLLAIVLNVNVYISNFFSMALGFTNNFFWNAHFNFKKKDRLFNRYIKFASIAIFGIFISNVIIYIFYNLLGFSEIASKLISIIIIVIIQFYLNSKITFRN